VISSIQRTLTIDERKYIGPRRETRCEEASHKREIVAARPCRPHGFGLCRRHACRYRDFSCLVSRRIVIAYWLIPTEPLRSYFQSVINDLAERYNAPVFEPHVTVHVGVECTNTVDEVLSKAGQGCERIVLQSLEVSGSSEFTKTLFVQFAVTTQLQRLNQSIRIATQNSSDYQLNPHLSLLYKTISTQDRQLLTHSIDVPFPEVAFDSLKAVRCVSPTESRADVEAWHVVAAKPLGSMGV
jgi:2'-5' RNA ligase